MPCATPRPTTSAKARWRAENWEILRTWDILNLTREQTRQMAQWAEGMRLDIHTPQARSDARIL